ncbi:DUF4123 domain-containing protein [Motilimonas sp. E26]|uniref:DUF4123 domain-containing protein n=1 Tax=Motilimonas sp. E26 TaxID=2865674 RepID=UPI001E3DE40A|nr:DUF4123 domain-containing protein [Motilimonas sp. E26]MCE0559325.1 DUF4123 domain-containing protein [Motilimonas sp. E26]
MNLQQKLQNLEEEEKFSSYLIMDQAKSNSLLTQLYELDPKAEIEYLYADTSFNELRELSPIILNLGCDSPLIEPLSLQSDWQKSTIIIATSHTRPYLFQLLRNRLVLQQEQGKPLFFRYFSSGVLPSIFNTLTSSRFSQFSDAISTWLVYSNDNWQQLSTVSSSHVLQDFTITTDEVGRLLSNINQERRHGH